MSSSSISKDPQAKFRKEVKTKWNLQEWSKILMPKPGVAQIQLSNEMVNYDPLSMRPGAENTRPSSLRFSPNQIRGKKNQDTTNVNIVSRTMTNWYLR